QRSRRPGGRGHGDDAHAGPCLSRFAHGAGAGDGPHQSAFAVHGAGGDVRHGFLRYLRSAAATAALCYRGPSAAATPSRTQFRECGRGTAGRPLWIEEVETWTEREVTLAPGDALLLYTEGMIEGTNTAGEQFFLPAEDGIRDWSVSGVQTCALPI